MQCPEAKTEQATAELKERPATNLWGYDLDTDYSVQPTYLQHTSAASAIVKEPGFWPVPETLPRSVCVCVSPYLREEEDEIGGRRGRTSKNNERDKTVTRAPTAVSLSEGLLTSAILLRPWTKHAYWLAAPPSRCFSCPSHGYAFLTGSCCPVSCGATQTQLIGTLVPDGRTRIQPALNGYQRDTVRILCGAGLHFVYVRVCTSMYTRASDF